MRKRFKFCLIRGISRFVILCLPGVANPRTNRRLLLSVVCVCGGVCWDEERTEETYFSGRSPTQPPRLNTQTVTPQNATAVVGVIA